MTLKSLIRSADTLEEVAHERFRQDERWGQQDHPNGTGYAYLRAQAAEARRDCNRAAVNGSVTWRHILTEEVAEAFAESDPAALRRELIQVAAVATAWVEAIDRGQR